MWKQAILVAAFVVASLGRFAPASALWYPDGRLTYDDASSVTSINSARCVAVQGSGVAHVVWSDYRDGDWEIYYKRYDRVVWGPDTRLTYSAGFSGNPAVAVGDDGVVHVVWDDYRDGNSEIYYKKHDGVSWSADERLTSAAGNSQNPSIAVSGPEVHVAWHDFRDADFEVYYRKHDGVSWLADERLTDVTGASLHPSVAAGEGGRVHVVWHDYRDGNSQVYYDEYDGSSWSGNVRLTATEETADYPCICSGAGGDLSVVWSDDRDGDDEIYYKKRTGGEWGPDERLTVSAGLSRHPSIASGDADTLHLVWSDKRDGNSEIYYRMHDGVSWGIGERLTDAPGASQNASVARSGSPPVHVVWQDGRDGKSEIYWKRTVTATLPPPVVDYVDPDSGYFGCLQEAVVTGRNFVMPVQVLMRKSGEPDVQARKVIVASQESLLCEIDLLLAEEGVWDIVVKNPDTNRDTLPGAFTVIRAPKPEISGITPGSGDWGESVSISDLAGSGFIRYPDVWLRSPDGDSLAATDVVAVTPERVTCNFSLDYGPSGFWDVMLENPDGQRDTLASGFYVNPLPAPTLTLVSPDEGPQGTLLEITIRGYHLEDPVSVFLERGGYEKVYAEIHYVNWSHTRVHCGLNLVGVENGLWGFVVEIADGQRVEWPYGFTVLQGPQIYSIDPDSAGWGETVHVDAITGRDFSDPMTVWLQRDGAEDVMASDVVVVTLDSMTCVLPLGEAPPGIWDVGIENAYDQVDILPGGFEITPAPPPLIYGVWPDSGCSGFPVHIDSVVGANFLAGAVVALEKEGEPGINGSNVTLISPEVLSCDFDLAGAAPGSWDLTLENPDSSSVALYGGFRVILGPPPEISAVSPDSGLMGYPVHMDSITGANFREGANVRLQRTGCSDVIASDVDFHSPGLLSCDLNLYGVEPGAWDVVVANLDSQRDTLEGGFRVFAGPRPEIVSVRPDSGYSGFQVHVDSITGYEFIDPAEVILQKQDQPDIAGFGVTVHSPNLMTCDLDLTGAVAGLWDVVVVNPDGQRDTLEDGFGISSAPAIEIFSITPTAGPQGLVVHITGIAGRNFFPTTSVRLERPGRPDITGSNVLVASPESLTCDFNLGNAEVGLWDVVVENEDGQSARLTAGFTVYTDVRVDLVDPESWQTGETVHITNLKGIGFISSMSVRLVKDGEIDIHAANVVAENSRRLTMDFDLSDAAAGDWSVIVGLEGGDADTLPGGFTVLPFTLWFPEIYLTTGDYDENTSSTSARSVAAGPDGRIHVVWEDDRNGNPEIYYRQYNGAEWEDEQRLTDTVGQALAPAVAADALGNAHVVWVDLTGGDWRIYHDVFDGATWAGNQPISSSIEVGGTSCAVAADGYGNTYVVWLGEDSFEWDVFFRKHDGVSWLDQERVTDYWSSKASPSVACDDSGNVHVAWYDNIDGSGYDSEIYHAMYDGSAWSAPERISFGAGESWTPCIAGGRGDEAHVVWADRRSGYLEIYYRHYDGTSWEPEMAVTDWSIEAANASVAVDASGTPHAVWRDLRAHTEEIYHSLLGVYGWEPTYRLSIPGSYSRKPSVAIDPAGKFHVVWQGYTGGWNIHYRSGYPGAFAGVEVPSVGPRSLPRLSVSPNPVLSSARISFSGMSSGATTVSIYDVEGRLIWSEMLGADREDRNTIIWNRRDMNDRRISPGIYFVNITEGGNVSSAKFVVLR